jgi:hypothetical protein
VHTGLADDPEVELERLLRSMVLPPGQDPRRRLV